MMAIKVSMEKGLEKCYGCGRENPIGFKLIVRQEEGKVKGEFVPGEYHQGWAGVIHGGVICTLLDEVMSYATYFQGIKTITAKMEIRFFQPVIPGQKLFLAGEITRKSRRLVKTFGRVELGDGSVIAESNASLYVTE